MPSKNEKFAPEICQSCAYFKIFTAGWLGECRKHAPLVVERGERWPVVEEDSWCGEWKFHNRKSQA